MRGGRAPTMVLLARVKIDLGVPRHHRLLLPWGSTHSRLCDNGPPPLRPSLGRRSRMVAVVYDRCCGLDVHKETIAVAVAGVALSKRTSVWGFAVPTNP